MRLNFDNAYFEYKFGRNPKVWNIGMVHDLWVKSKQRSEIRLKQLQDCIYEIVQTVEPLNKNHRNEPEYRVFFNHKKNVMCYKISKQDIGYCYSVDTLKFESRDEKLTFILSNQNSFDLGEKMKYLESLLTYQDRKLMNLLNEMIQKILRDKFKKKDVSGALIIQISGKSYFVKIDNSNFHYRSFELLNEVTPETTIKI
jgi:hypothetical protein